MGKYIVQKPVDMVNLTAKARALVEAHQHFDITPKYDGCCAVLVFNDLGLYSGGYSATGEPASSMYYVGKWIENNWRRPPLRNVALLGEAWAPDLEFPEISGMFRRQAPQAGLGFVPFDAVRFIVFDPLTGLPVLEDTRPYSVRLNTLLDRYYDNCNVRPMPHYVGNLEQAVTLAKGLKQNGGFDGAIVRFLDAPYHPTRCKHEVVKVKPTLSLDLKVIELTETVGEKTGRAVYTLAVSYKGVRSEVGSGVPHVLPTDLVLGAIVEIECLGVTADGKLREPRFKGVRHDKVDTD